MIKPKTNHEQAYNEGQQAHFKGESYDTNDYRCGSKCSHSWKLGYCAAERGDIQLLCPADHNKSKGY